jgi:hypothetical protein
MGQAIPKQHPAVVLRSHYNFVRALLGVAMIAVVGLTIAVLVVANNDDEIAATNSVQSAPVTQSPAQPDGVRYDGGPEEGTRGAIASPPAPGTRYDGGPEEGTRGAIVSPQSASPLAPGTRYDGGPDEGSRGLSAQPQAPDARYDGGPEEGTRGPGLSTD